MESAAFFNKQVDVVTVISIALAKYQLIINLTMLKMHVPTLPNRLKITINRHHKPTTNRL